jgi:hypothetical protein
VSVGCHRCGARRNFRRKIAQLAREKERLTYERTFALHALQTQSYPRAPSSVAESQLPAFEPSFYVSESVGLVPLGLPRLPGTYCAGTPPRSDDDSGASVASGAASGSEMRSGSEVRSGSEMRPWEGQLVGRPPCVARPRGWYGSMGTSSCGSTSEIEGYLPAPRLRTTLSSLTPALVPQPTVQPLTQPQALTETCGHLVPALEVSREPEIDEPCESPTLLASQAVALRRGLAQRVSRFLTSSSSSSIGRPQGVEMRPIDERCDTASRVSPWSWIFPSRVEASNIQGDPLDSAALAAAAGGSVSPSTRSRPAVVTAARPPPIYLGSLVRPAVVTAAGPPPALSTMDHLDQRIAKPGNGRTARSVSNGGSSYGTDSELEANFPSHPPSRYAAAMATTSPAQSLLQLPPTRSPTPTPQSLARLEALTRTLRECGLEPLA